MHSLPHKARYVLPNPHKVGEAHDMEYYLGPILSAMDGLPGEVLEQVTKTKVLPEGTEVEITRYVWRE